MPELPAFSQLEMFPLARELPLEELIVLMRAKRLDELSVLQLQENRCASEDFRSDFLDLWTS